MSGSVVVWGPFHGSKVSLTAVRRSGLSIEVVYALFSALHGLIYDLIFPVFVPIHLIYPIQLHESRTSVTFRKDSYPYSVLRTYRYVPYATHLPKKGKLKIGNSPNPSIRGGSPFLHQEYRVQYCIAVHSISVC